MMLPATRFHAQADGPRSAAGEARAGSLQRDLGKVDRHVEGDVDVVGEEIQGDMRHDLDNLLVAEAVLPQAGDVGIADLGALLDDLEREGQRRGGLGIAGLPDLGGGDFVSRRARLGVSSFSVQ